MPASPAMGAALLTRVSHQHRIMQPHVEIGQVRLQHIGSEDQFSIALGEQVEPGHQCGPPPKTFFSHTSPSE